MYSEYKKTSATNGGQGDVFHPLTIPQEELRQFGKFPIWGGSLHG